MRIKNLSERISLILGNINEKKELIDSFAKKSGKSVKEVERLWDKSKGIVKEQYPDIEDGGEKFFQLVVGVLKRILKI